MRKDNFTDQDTMQSSDDLQNQWIIFICGGQRYGLKAENSQEIARLGHIIKAPGLGEFCRGMVSMRGRIFNAIDLSILLGHESSNAKREEMHKLLELREQDHVRWLDELLSSVQERRQFKLTTDPHACAFGKWYDNFKTEDFYLSQALRAFDQPHQAIHKVGIEVVELIDKGRSDEAMSLINATWNKELALLKKLFAEARDYLREIFRETIVIFDLEGEFAGVIVDEVLEVREIRREQIKQVTAEDYLDEKYMEGTAILGDHVILLMDIFKIAKA